MGCLLRRRKKNKIENKNVNNQINYNKRNYPHIGVKTTRNNFLEHNESQIKIKNINASKKEEQESSCLELDENKYNENNTFKNDDNINDSKENFIIYVKDKPQYNKNEKNIGSNIINQLLKLDFDKLYSYKLISNIHSFQIKQEEKKEEDFTIVLKNDGEIKWIENETYLKCVSKNCPFIFIDDIKLESLNTNEIKDVQIKFRNLDQCPKGKYTSVFDVVIKGKKIGESIYIYFTVN